MPHIVYKLSPKRVFFSRKSNNKIHFSNKIIEMATVPIPDYGPDGARRVKVNLFHEI